MDEVVSRPGRGAEKSRIKQHSEQTDSIHIGWYSHRRRDKGSREPDRLARRRMKKSRASRKDVS
eukprot:scaffold907_cov318-Pavlova_lutheri.AAC.8